MTTSRLGSYHANEAACFAEARTDKIESTNVAESLEGEVPVDFKTQRQNPVWKTN